MGVVDARQADNENPKSIIIVIVNQELKPSRNGTRDPRTGTQLLGGVMHGTI